MKIAVVGFYLGIIAIALQVLNLLHIPLVNQFVEFFRIFGGA